MKTRKQSLRQTIDSALVSRAQSVVDDMIADPIGSTQKSLNSRLAERPLYVRGALVKSNTYRNKNRK
jgi:hypothetical protein